MRFTLFFLIACVLLACSVSAKLAEDMQALRSSILNLIPRTKVGQLSMPVPFNRDATVKNSIETVSFDDTDCQTAVCEAIDSFEPIVRELASEVAPSPSLVKMVTQCGLECLGAYYGCATVTDSFCSMLNINQAECSSELSSFDDLTMDDFSFDPTDVCLDESTYELVENLVDVASTCGSTTVEFPRVNLNSSVLVTVNSLCTQNDNDVYCSNLVSQSMAIAASLQSCDDFYSVTAIEDTCTIVSTWGCCSSTLSMILPPCVGQYLTETCGLDMTDYCTEGMFDDVTSVSSSITLDSYYDLSQWNVTVAMMTGLVAGASMGGAEVEPQYVSIRDWYGTTATTIDFRINIIGDILDADAMMATIDSSAFNTGFAYGSGATIVSKTTSSSTSYDAEPTSFDGAFSLEFSTIYLLAAMMVGLALF